MDILASLEPLNSPLCTLWVESRVRSKVDINTTMNTKIILQWKINKWPKSKGVVWSWRLQPLWIVVTIPSLQRMEEPLHHDGKSRFLGSVRLQLGKSWQSWGFRDRTRWTAPIPRQPHPRQHPVATQINWAIFDARFCPAPLLSRYEIKFVRLTAFKLDYDCFHQWWRLFVGWTHTCR